MQQVVYSFTDELDEGEVVRVVPDGDRLFILMDSSADRQPLARALSVEVSLHVQDAWLYVGDRAATP